MADYAGAVAAMRAHYEANFAGVPTQFQNEDPPQKPWPPAPKVPWCYFEVMQTQSDIRGAGLPGNQTWLTVGHIRIHVFAPKGYGFGDHLALAQSAGEIFRSKTLYQSSPGAKVLCMAPSVQGGDSTSDDGNWFGITVSIPFEFYFIA